MCTCACVHVRACMRVHARVLECMCVIQKIYIYVLKLFFRCAYEARTCEHAWNFFFKTVYFFKFFCLISFHWLISFMMTLFARKVAYYWYICYVIIIFVYKVWVSKLLFGDLFWSIHCPDVTDQPVLWLLWLQHQFSFMFKRKRGKWRKK